MNNNLNVDDSYKRDNKFNSKLNIELTCPPKFYQNVNITNNETSKMKNNLESRNMENILAINENKNDTSINDLSEKYCIKCFIDIPIRGKHCKICQFCISTFDHHCVWVGNCIGENNRKFFLIFLFTHCIELLFNIGIVIQIF